jgi:hypothetical protein
MTVQRSERFDTDLERQFRWFFYQLESGVLSAERLLEGHSRLAAGR